MIKLLSLIFLGALVSCGGPQGFWPDPSDSQTVYKTEPAVAEAFSYELRTRSCSTGKHSFGTFEAACDALKDDALNKDCAEEKREELFTNSACPGDFT